MKIKPLEFECIELDPTQSYHRSKISLINESWIRSTDPELKYNLRTSEFGPIIRSVMEPGLFRSSTFEDKIYDSEFNHSELIGSKFRGSLEKSSLRNTDSRGIVANDIIIRNNSFRGSNLYKAKFNNSDLSGSDLSGTNLDMVEFRNSNISEVNFRYSKNLTNAIFYETIVDQDTYNYIWEQFAERGLILNTKVQDYFNIL